MSEQVLKVENVTMQFGGVVAVDNLNLEINQGEIVALIGPNGAGKTTAFNVVTGVYQPTNGAVWFQGEKIIENYPQGKMKKLYKGQHAGDYTRALAPTPDKITKLGMARTFQNIRLWKSQSVFDNVLIAKHCRVTSNLFTATFHLNGKEEAQQRQDVEELLEIVGLADVKEELATSLPYGKQRRLEIAHEPGHGHLRPDLRAGLRRADRPRHAGGDPEQSARYRRVPGGGRGCLKSRISTWPTGASRPCGASPWRCPTARSSR